MAELTIRLRVDPSTGKRDVIIGYRSDEDALPMEHEDEHRRLVERLIEGGVVRAEELGTVTVEREQPSAAEVELSTDDDRRRQREGVEQG